MAISKKSVLKRIRDKETKIKRKNVTYRIDESVSKAFRDYAEKQKTTCNMLMEELLKEFLEL
jgi:predicted HicB family RNase H-like nuclease